MASNRVIIWFLLISKCFVLVFACDPGCSPCPCHSNPCACAPCAVSAPCAPCAPYAASAPCLPCGASQQMIGPQIGSEMPQFAPTAPIAPIIIPQPELELEPEPVIQVVQATPELEPEPIVVMEPQYVEPVQIMEPAVVMPPQYVEPVQIQPQPLPVPVQIMENNAEEIMMEQQALNNMATVQVPQVQVVPEIVQQPVIQIPQNTQQHVMESTVEQELNQFTPAVMQHQVEAQQIGQQVLQQQLEQANQMQLVQQYGQEQQIHQIPQIITQPVIDRKVVVHHHCEPAETYEVQDSLSNEVQGAEVIPYVVNKPVTLSTPAYPQNYAMNLNAGSNYVQPSPIVHFPNNFQSLGSSGSSYLSEANRELGSYASDVDIVGSPISDIDNAAGYLSAANNVYNDALAPVGMYNDGFGSGSGYLMSSGGNGYLYNSPDILNDVGNNYHLSSGNSYLGTAGIGGSSYYPGGTGIFNGPPNFPGGNYLKKNGYMQTSGMGGSYFPSSGGVYTDVLGAPNVAESSYLMKSSGLSGMGGSYVPNTGGLYTDVLAAPDVAESSYLMKSSGLSGMGASYLPSSGGIYTDALGSPNIAGGSYLMKSSGLSGMGGTGIYNPALVANGGLGGQLISSSGTSGSGYLSNVNDNYNGAFVPEVIGVGGIGGNPPVVNTYGSNGAMQQQYENYGQSGGMVPDPNMPTVISEYHEIVEHQPGTGMIFRSGFNDKDKSGETEDVEEVAERVIIPDSPVYTTQSTTITA